MNFRSIDWPTVLVAVVVAYGLMWLLHARSH